MPSSTHKSLPICHRGPVVKCYYVSTYVASFARMQSADIIVYRHSRRVLRVFVVMVTCNDSLIAARSTLDHIVLVIACNGPIAMFGQTYVSSRTDRLR